MEDSDPDSDSDCPPEPKGKEDDVETSMLQSAVHFTVFKMSQDVSKDFQVAFSRQVIAAMAHHAFKTIETFGRDLELFARHAKRSTIGPEDVKLLFRNSPQMCTHLDTVLHEMRGSKNMKSKAGIKVKEAKLRAKSKPDENPHRAKAARVGRGETKVKAPETESNKDEDMDLDNDFDF